MRHTFLLLAGFIILLSACKQQQAEQSPDNQLVITPGMPPDFISDLNPYIDSIAVVPLEATPQSLLAHVRKMLLLPEGNFILSSNQNLLVFNPEGKYLYTIGQYGRGPEEYYGAMDICLNQGGEILNILTSVNEVVRYRTKDGSFLDRIPLHPPVERVSFEAIASGPENSFFLLSDPQGKTDKEKENFTLFHFDAKGKFLDATLPSKDYFLSMDLISQTYDNRYILRPQNQDNICYYLYDSVPQPRIRIDFGKKTIPDKYSPDVQTYLQSDYYKMPIYIHETADHFFFTFCGPEAREHYCVYSFSTHKTITWKRKGDDIIALFQLMGSDATYFYGIYNDYRSLNEIPLDDIDLLKKAVIEQTGVELQENDNPSLVKIRLKF